ncbi:hypothetical protein C0J52_11341 [Blattella germanica]|nr:hypothetical protein C0J52_11341 [Blattella germanica]
MSYQMLRCFATSGLNVNVKRSICMHRILCGTHYDTLKLPRNCTSKDVRDSFIKLSKKCHPDKNRDDPTTHAQFVKLNEAYSVLSRPEKRREYDLTLKPILTEKFHNAHQNSPFDVYTTAYRQRVVWRDESFWEYKDKSSHNQSGDYYGIRGMKRVPNGWIAILYSTAFNRQVLDDRSHEASRILSDVHDRALKHGNKMQLELLKQQSEKTQTLSGSPKKTPTSGPPPYDLHASHSKPQIHESNDSTKTQFAVKPESKMPEPSHQLSKSYLGYLGDMPHKVERDNLKPLLCNIPSGIEKQSRTVRGKQNAPKSVTNDQDMGMENIPTEQDSYSLVLHNLPNNIIKQNKHALPQPKLCIITNYHSNGNVETDQNLMTSEVCSTSNYFDMNAASELDTLGEHMSMLENGNAYICPVVNNLFPIYNNFFVHNSYGHLVYENQIFEPIKKHVGILEPSKHKHLTNVDLSVNHEPILTSDIILMTDSEILCDRLVPVTNRKK